MRTDIIVDGTSGAGEIILVSLFYGSVLFRREIHKSVCERLVDNLPFFLCHPWHQTVYFIDNDAFGLFRAHRFLLLDFDFFV